MLLGYGVEVPSKQDLASWESEGNIHIGLARRPVKARHLVIAEAVAEHTPIGGSVLDFGCGLGQTSELVQRLRPDIRITFADPYQACLEETSRHVDGTMIRLPENHIDLAIIPARYDSVIVSHVLEHALDPVGMAQSVLQLAVPGGVVVLAVPNLARPKVLWDSVRRKNYANRGHVVAWDAAHWRVFLENVLGVDVVDYLADEVQIMPSRLVGRSALLRRVERWLAGLLPWWAFSNIAVVRRGNN